ncbi:lanthionine synthetase C family protein [Clostridium sp. E02]|uniref:lanthionine synthetase C family protein n=1 Tax=Clostridium sp. E02 TaxID=2487134 RepID=UPI000F51BEB8|nr:lanthionine synthetase C family protein [Clostridium sp. E02]
MSIDTLAIIKKIGKKIARTDLEKEFPLNEFETLTLHSGLPGLVLFYGELQQAFPEEGWDETGNKFLTRLVSAIKQQGIPSLSMFSGAAGMGLAAVCLSENFKYYNHFISNVNEMIKEQLFSYIGDEPTHGIHMQVYDVIEGLSGILNYLLLFREDEGIRSALESGLNYLVTLITRQIHVKGTNVPGWYVPSEYQFSAMESQIYPNGNFNTSMSHGVAGPLALLSRCCLQGVVVKGQKRAIETLIDFLNWSKQRDEKRIFWKGQIDFLEYQMKCVNDEHSIRRDAWCYGPPGICYGMALGAKALNNHVLLHEVEGVFMDAIHDIRGIFSPTFCHGYAGLYQMVQAMEQLTGKSYLRERDRLKQNIVSYYNESNPYGFNNVETEGPDLIERASTGLLTGATGTCLALLSGELGSEKQLWQNAFLL